MEIPKAADILDAYIEHLDEERVPDGKFHPSSLWMCDRQAVMVARGEPQNIKPDAKTKRVFKIGNIIHEFIQEAMAFKYNHEDSHGTQMKSEFLIDEQYLTGHGDDVLFVQWLTEDEEAVVYEYKSTRNLSKVRKDKKANTHHIKQGATYCAGLAAAGTKVKELHVVYFEKTNLDIEEFVYPYDPAWRDEVDRKIADLAPYLDKPGEYPACTGEDWLKKPDHPYCPFYPICHQAKPSKPAEVFSWK
jgi:hypothetical protein